jgi:hypothetical protein
VVIIAACTIWVLFGTFLILQTTQLPAVLYRTAMTLLAAEFLALMMDDLGSPPVAAVGHSAAAIDVPLLSLLLVGVAIMRGWPSRGAGEGARHGVAREGRRGRPDRAR